MAAARRTFLVGLFLVASATFAKAADPKGDGTGGPGYTLPDEPPATAYKVGSVAMANAGPNTTGSQFFVTLSAAGAAGLGTTPPFKYSSLGTITKGMDVVQKLGADFNPAQTDDPSTQIPPHPLYIFSITITES